MYHFLKGKVDEVGKDFIILNVNNVGYFIFLATMKKFNIKYILIPIILVIGIYMLKNSTIFDRFFAMGQNQYI